MYTDKEKEPCATRVFTASHGTCPTSVEQSGKGVAEGCCCGVLEPNYYLLLFGTSVLNLHSALRGITPSNNFKSWFGAGRRRFRNSIKVSCGPWRWEQSWCECGRSQVLRFGISSVLAAGQRRNFFLGLPGHHLNPEQGRLMESLFHVEFSCLRARFCHFLCWMCCSVLCKAKLTQSEGSEQKFLFI